jgi:hypothetical protein
MLLLSLAAGVHLGLKMRAWQRESLGSMLVGILKFMHVFLGFIDIVMISDAFLINLGTAIQICSLIRGYQECLFL